MITPLEKIRATDQKTRNTRATLVKVLEAVESFKSETINKRLCTHIESLAPRYPQVVQRYGEDKKTEMRPTYYTNLEKKDYGTQYILNISPAYGQDGERRSFWFNDKAELIAELKKTIEGMDEYVQDLMNLAENIDGIMARYEVAKKEINAIGDIKGIYCLADMISFRV
jgi:hypothetical protein